ncbi:MAG: MBL fold metallo-hydrolase [Chloroflexi bacterium]|nr:MBL fold metallo-hydrolase [Chloroflexota bacterium]
MTKITCLIDNTVQHASPFWGEHGLSLLIETDAGRLLFDTGQTEQVLAHNLNLLGDAPRAITALALSHAHTDHTGGLNVALALKPGMPLYANPDLFCPRYAIRDRKYRSIGLRMSRDELARRVDLHLSATPVEIVPGVWTTGEIADRSELEGRSDRLVVSGDVGWQPDPYRDDMSLVMETTRGLAVVCGCCHAGLLNTLAQVHRDFRKPIVAIIGGTHLVDADAEHLQRVVRMLREVYGAPRLHLNHCTGERALIALANAFDDRVQPFPAGTSLDLD